jgi:hypothetical protein
MGRRRSSGSGIGYLILLVIGGIVYLANVAYKFVVDNQAIVLAFSGIVVGGWLLHKFSRARQREEPAPTITARIETTALREPEKAARYPKRTAPAARWIEPGETVVVENIKINSGLFYFGESLAVPGRGTTNQYIVNPKLRLSSVKPDLSGESMPYWPSYASITPAARRAFLQWMAEGRVGSAYGIGYVFIFLYGLEHRIFVEKAPNAAQVLLPEVERLLSTYGENNSFRGYANNFLLYARLASGVPFSPPQLSAERSGSAELDPATRLYLGKKLSASNKLSSHDALLWILKQPDTYLRTPAVRCFDEFVSLWNIRFREKFPDGFKVAVPKQSIRFTYRAASGAFQIDVPGPHSNLPDVMSAQQSLDPLKKVVQACTEELETFSRFVGKRPDQRTSVEAALLLPTPLKKQSRAALESAAGGLSALMGERNTATTQFQNVLSAVGIDYPEQGKIPAMVHERLSQALDLLDVAIEPDRRYGGAAAQLDDQVVIFRADKGGAIDASKPAYQAKKVEVEVAALAAAADGESTIDEMQAIIANLKATSHLSRMERLRLIAYTVTIFRSPPKQARIMRRLTQLSEGQRRDIAVAAKSIILKPDKIDLGEVRFFERLHKALGLPKEQVYSDIHRAAAVSDEPVVIASESRAAGVPISPEPKPGIRIDPNRLAVIQQQTQQVSSLLSQIFVDDDAPPEPTAMAPAKGSVFDGLDRDHAELVELLDLKGEITRKEFEDRAKSLDLLPDGAIEIINEWSFDHFDEPLLEDGEHVVIAADLKKRLAELRVSET